MPFKGNYPLRRALVVLVSLGLTGTPGFGDPMPYDLRGQPLYSYILNNGAGSAWTLADVAGQWVVLSVTPRTLEEEAWPWRAELDVMLEGREAIRIPIANLQRPPRILYGMIRRRMRHIPSVYVDWDGSYTEALSLNEEHFHLMLVSPDAQVVGHVHGSTTPENLAVFNDLIRMHVPLTPEE